MTSRAAVLVFRVTLLLWLLTGAGAQSGSKAGAADTTSRAGPESSYVIRSNSRLVQVSVVVQDRLGAPILGLKKEDFTLLDDGKAQDIAFFSANAPAPVHEVAPLARNVFTNRSQLKGQDPGATIVLLFDLVNTSFEDQAFARWHILRFLRSVKPQDRIAIFALTTELTVVHDFSQDPASLASSLDQFSPRSLAPYDASHPAPFHVQALANDPFWAAFEGHVNNANGEIADAFVSNRFQTTYAAIEAIANYVTNIPGHKSLVWVSDGIPIQLGSDHIGVSDRESFTFDNPNASGPAGGKDLSALARILNRANLAIYPIDAHGIDVDDSAGAFFQRQNQRDSFRLLAEKTGGKAFYGTNDIAGAIRSAFEDDRYTYTIGFYPNHGEWDGRFREIKIELPARGSRLRYRRGYFAVREGSELEAVVKNEAAMKLDLQGAAQSPVDATSLGVILKGTVLKPMSAHALQLQITLDPKQFLLHDRENRQEGGLDLLFLQKNSAGKFLAAEKQHFDVRFGPQEYAAVAKSGLVLQRKLAIDPGASEIRVVVRDTESGTLGSVTVPTKQFSWSGS